MARSNTGSTSNRAQAAGTPVANTPATLACWFNPANLTTNQNLVFARSDTTNTPDYLGLTYDGANGNGQGDNVVLAITGNAVGESFGVSSTGGTAGAWMHCAAVFGSSTNRTAYRDGVAGTTDTASRVITTLNLTGNGLDIGIIAVGASFFSPLNGSIAEIGVWDVALTASEIASLAKGVSPLLIRPASLAFYSPFGGRGTERDWIGNRAITITGTMAQAAHPPGLKGPQDAFVPGPPATGGGTPATATGATVTEQGSLVAGSATGAATGATATVALNTTLIAGAATGAASAAAATVTQARALVSGAATGAASVATVTVTEQESVLAGSATGAATGAAATVTEVAALVSGAATGAATGAAATVTLATSLIAGVESGAASAAGATVSEVASISAGSVSAGGTGNASGVTVSLAASLSAGAAAGAGTASGVTLAEAASLIAGGASGSAGPATVVGATVALATALIGGAGTGAALAPLLQTFDQLDDTWDSTGVTLDDASGSIIGRQSLVLVPGAAVISSGASGVTLTEATSLIAGAAVGNTAPIVAGATVTAVTTLIAGAASSAIPAMVTGTELTLPSGLIAGVASGAAIAPVVVTFDQTGSTWDSTGSTFDNTGTHFIGLPSYTFVSGAVVVAVAVAGVTFETSSSFIASPANVPFQPVTVGGDTLIVVASLEVGTAQGLGWNPLPEGEPTWTNVAKPSDGWTVVPRPGGTWDKAA